MVSQVSQLKRANGAHEKATYLGEPVEAGEQVVEQLDELLRWTLRGQRGEALNVGKEDAEVEIERER